MNISLIRVAFICCLCVGMFFLLQDVQGVQRTPIKQSLQYFPKTLGQWQVKSEMKSSAAVIGMLGVDDYLDYNYQNTADDVVNFYVAYYEAVGGGRGYHSPKNCIPGGGWGIDSVNTVTIKGPNLPEPVTVSELIIRNRNEYQVVYYWFQNRGRIIASEYWEKIYLVLDAITMKRRDGSFVRLISYAPGGDLDTARERLNQFAPMAMQELENFLPGAPQ
ncbi:exosortase C-terminal domain/associated protein EpsI [Desulfogranum japonicum]|uniref:exosortase C-terminal domain/associated protein EpsI n=1 Tax=Desulfogranum japonicum TaxID=231447 RepID=UPI00041F2158|nr:exosortase C-terminal domain/associated protein EpsI [Desulfogranum japonicum]